MREEKNDTLIKKYRYNYISKKRGGTEQNNENDERERVEKKNACLYSVSVKYELCYLMETCLFITLSNTLHRVVPSSIDRS